MNTLVNERKHREFKVIANILRISDRFDLTMLQRMYLQQMRWLEANGHGGWMAALTDSHGHSQPDDVAQSDRGPTYFPHA